MGAWVSREGFSSSDPIVETTIKRLAPGANVANYRSVVDSFYRDVVQAAPDTPTPQSVDAFLGQQGTLTGTEKVEVRLILLDLFKIRPGPAEERESKQIKFQPDATALQGRMAALPIPDNAPPADYVSADPDPVLPDSKKMAQVPTMNRGGSGEAAAYTWDMAAYQHADVAGQYPSKGFRPATVPPGHVRESMSTMAGTTTITNEIYGPRVPKERGKPVLPTEGDGGKPTADEMFPMMYGPSMKSVAKPPQTGLGDLTGHDTIPPTAFILPATAKTEPVPFLADFSKFGK